ncbi:hypothetical protein GCM10009798_13900 [Nocardioides panacihumi]|uniref:Uncharacterized protein n=1 Tax=Nocardioides panacihumi TaxID=400774 RepID=A0ABP5C0J0_9ACTN
MSTPILRLTLVAAPGPITVVEASLPSDSDPSDDRRITLDPAEFGIPVSLTGQPIDDTAFRIPRELDRLLASVIETDDRPDSLWLQLVAPFGYLGLVPWERLLVDRFGIGVVRLPVLTLTRRRSDSLQVVLLIAVPNPERSSDLRTSLHGARVATTSRLGLTPSSEPHKRVKASRPTSRAFTAGDVDRLLGAILRGLPHARTTVNVVATPWLHTDLKARWRKRDPETWPVRLHDAYILREEVQRSAERGSLAQTPWLRTLEAALHGEQADVVHLVCDASVNDAATRLVVADPLKTSTNVASRYVSLRTLMATLDEIGAWAVCMTAPAYNDVAPQLRHVASRLAELRPGPILMTDAARDPDFLEVEAGYRFLFTKDPGAPPRLRSGLVCCEPPRVAAAVPEAVAVSSVIETPQDEQPRGAVAELIAGGETPMWLAAAQRFVEQRQVELAQFERDSGPDGLSPEAAAIARGVKRALTVIQDVLEERTRHSGGQDG